MRVIGSTVLVVILFLSGCGESSEFQSELQDETDFMKKRKVMLTLSYRNLLLI
jgi:hypothetical protein